MDRIWIYGQPFSGKTTFASQFPNAKIISTDGNAKYLFKKEDIFEVKNYKDLNDTFAKLKSGEKLDTLIIDTTGYLLDYIKFYFLEKNHIEDPGDIAYKGWTMMRNMQWEIILGLANLAETVIFISHEKQTIEKNKFGRELTTFEPDFDEKLRDKMTGIMTLVGRAVKDTSEKSDTKYWLDIGHTDDEVGGTRMPLKNTRIELSYDAFKNNIDMGGN